MSIDLVITGVILASAGIWAGRRIWRAARPTSGARPRAGGCGSGCSGCAVGGAKPAGNKAFDPGDMDEYHRPIR